MSTKPKRTRNSPTPRSGEIAVAALFGIKTRLPLVSLKLKDVAVMLEVEEARDLAANLLECAEAAEGDGFLVTWLQERLQTTPEQAVSVLAEFRAYRAQLWQQYHEVPATDAGSKEQA